MQPALNLDVVTYREDGRWLAHCLQLDLAEAGDTPDGAEDALLGVIRAHVEWAFADGDMAHLFSPAPPETWQRFWAGEARGTREVPLAVAPDRQPAPPFVTIQRATAVASA